MLQSQTGLGVIILDHKGQVMGTLCAKKRLYTKPFIAEAIGLLEAVCFCKEAGFTSVILKGDALQVVKLLGEKTIDWSEGGCIINDTRQFLNSFTHWSD